MRVSKKEIAGVTILLCMVIILFFWKIVFRNNIFQVNWETYSIHNSSDELEQYYTWRYYAAETIIKGRVPLWNPFVSSGAPLLANDLSGVFYPLSILFYLFSVEKTLAFTSMLHIFIAGFMMYIFLRLNSLAKIGALIGAIIFALNGTVVTKFVDPASHAASVWLPIILILMEKFLLSRKIHFAYLTGLFLGIGTLAGNLQDIYNGVILLFFYSIFKVYCYYGISKRKLLIYWQGLFSIVFISLTIGAIQIIPTFELVKLTDRTLSYSQQLDYALGWQYLNNLIITPIITDPEQLFSLNAIEGYVGIAGIVLLVAALWFRKRKEVYFYGVIGALFLLSAIGDPVYRLFRILPGFKCLNGGAYMLDMFVFSVAVLAAIGYESIADNMNRGGKRIRNFKVGLSILTVIWLSWIWLQQDKYEIVKLILTTVYLLLTAGWFLFKRQKNNLLKGEALLLLVLLDLLGVGISYSMNQIMTSAPGNVITHLQELKFLKEDHSPGRIMRYRNQVYLPNSLMLLGLSDAQGSDSFTVSKYGAFLNLIEGNLYISKDSENYRIHEIQQEVSLYSGLLDLLNVKYILTTEEFFNPKYKKIYARYNPVYKQVVIIYENLKVMPRSFIVFQETCIKDDNLILAYLKSNDFAPAKEIVIATGSAEDNLGKDNTNKIDYANKATLPIISYYGYNEVELNTDTSRKGWLFLGDTYYPGWKAYVDGKRVNIYRANYAFRAILLEPGKHFVKFIYDPFSFKAGLYLLIGISILGTFLAIRSIRAIEYC